MKNDKKDEKTMKIEEDKKYYVKFYTSNVDYTWTVVWGSELIALISRTLSSCPKYYELNGSLYNLERFYKISWDEEYDEI